MLQNTPAELVAQGPAREFDPALDVIERWRRNLVTAAADASDALDMT
jgi:hypothetical protein